MSSDPIALLGATGYIGGRLLKRLRERSLLLRCLARRPESLEPLRAGSTEIVAGDVLDPAACRACLRGTQTVYYLIHSMSAPGNFEEKDRQAARNVAEAAKEAGVSRIIYLGGLGDSHDPLSPHLASRHEVGEILRRSGVQVIEFRASIVLGAGSLSFELIRALVERLPAMVTPRWVSVPAQPIAVEDLLNYLLAALDKPLEGNPIFEIGGPDTISYGGLMREYARQRGLRRLMIPVPVLTPYLSSLWLALVTPLYARVGRRLIESIRYPTVVRDFTAREFFKIPCRDVRQAIAEAILGER